MFSKKNMPITDIDYNTYLDAWIDLKHYTQDQWLPWLDSPEAWYNFLALLDDI
jgi:hypothetical protein